MNNLKVSICLPNLNTRPYLDERIATIEAQTLSDWEVIAVDSYSEDGSFEFLEQFSTRDARVTLFQAPRDGIYPNFNRCIERARGEFVYIATSDDTMAADCLEKMVRALEENPDCDLAHCPMKVIDEHGAEGRDWWSVSSHFAKSSGEFLERRHKRVAPFDGILCLLGENIYSSVTQLLIRRSLFDKIGYYKADWGAIGDFHWSLRAGLAASVVHVPDTWGGWRMHQSQATAAMKPNSLEHHAKIDAMIDDVLTNIQRYIGHPNCSEKFRGLAEHAREVRCHLREHTRLKGVVERRLFLIGQALTGSRPAREHLVSLFSGGKCWPKGAPEAVGSWFDEAVLVPLDRCG